MLSRRHFIKQTALAIPAMSLAGFLLSSCRKQIVEPSGKRPKVGIIGAGIAGLHAAKVLALKYHCEVEILEAGDRVGGRIQSYENAFGAFDVELGANAIYGQNNAWYDMVRSTRTTEITPYSASSYYIDGNSYSDTDISDDADFKVMLEQLNGINNFTGGNEVTVEQYMEMNGVPERVKFIFEGISEEMLGTSIDRASVRLNSGEGLGKIDDNKYYTEDESFYQILLREYGNILPNVMTNTPITSIDYSGEKIKVCDKMQVVREYDKVIVTVPLSILKLKANEPNHIRFTPELPESKHLAMDNLGMDSGVRIILKLNRKFWHHDSKTVYTKGIIGKYEVVKEDLLSNQFILSATVSGEMAEKALDMKNEKEIINMIEADWAQSIGSAAHGAIVDYKIKYWSKDPYIRGTFSYHKTGGDSNTRKELAKSIDNKVYFAGEACHSGNLSGSINGALETGSMAAEEIASKFA